MATTAKTSEASDMRTIVLASSAGTVFEWYDFFIYGSLASVIAAHFFSGVNEQAGFIFALLVFAAGFAMRPLGALVFGRIGDRVGRKRAFLITMTLMGLSTCAIGLLPTYAQVGIAAPIALIAMRLLQGIALGGEYGGAAIYVVEHAKKKQRGLMTGFIQTTAAIGLCGAMVIVYATRKSVGDGNFADWGWRIPFLVSLPLLGISIWFRLRLSESPAFKHLRDSNALSPAPFTESFLKWQNLKLVLLTLFGVTAAQGAIWYTCHFYALFFLERLLKVESGLVNLLIGGAVATTAVLYFFFAWLSDKVGRKPVIYAGMALAVLTFFPGFRMLTEAANPALGRAAAAQPVVVIADPSACALQLDVIGKAEFSSSCDIAKSTLASAGVTYRNEAGPAGSIARIRIGTREIAGKDAVGTPEERKALRSASVTEIKGALAEAGYPEKADSAAVDRWKVFGILVWFIACATALYGPQAAALAEIFPTRIRYTALSVPYHIGTGIFGGFMPATAFAIVAATGNIYAGLWYPVIIGAISLVIGLIYFPETHKRELDLHTAIPAKAPAEGLAKS